ncbi:DUF2487 family protein [Cohnella zeiphila]|uniref:DUF2487 family protein n=1 Tax=Cohnella zeiphila TaxID=2761120 RepID=A0A7X0SSR3_9BACL|nr:DUF2487 family protein [Cohnella zeiphila]MBB6735448.1 DUF2487 family protein [Cohnella zeiphila]
MKFSEFNKEEEWADLAPYLDTCLLPVTGLTGEETPPEAADKAAEAGKWLQPLELAFRGRTVTLPAYHYADVSDEGERERLVRYCERVKRSAYRYLIVVTGEAGWTAQTIPPADLIAGPAEAGEEPDPEALKRAVAALWKGIRD